MFKRIANLFRGFLGLFTSGLESKNAEALLENEKENLRAQIAKYNGGLASHAGMCERLKSQVNKQEKEVNELNAKAAAAGIVVDDNEDEVEETSTSKQM